MTSDIETSTTVEPVTEKFAYQALFAFLKAGVKADMGLIRAERAHVRLLGEQAAVAQSTLAKLRHMARARHAVYGMSRGQQWSRFEHNHAEGDPKLVYAMTKIWTEASKALAAQGFVYQAPEGLAPWVTP